MGSLFHLITSSRTQLVPLPAEKMHVSKATTHLQPVWMIQRLRRWFYTPTPPKDNIEVGWRCHCYMLQSHMHLIRAGNARVSNGLVIRAIHIC